MSACRGESASREGLHIWEDLHLGESASGGSASRGSASENWFGRHPPSGNGVGGGVG